jgi:hypothetical protein
MDEAALSALWREKSLRYISAVNAFVERGLRDGWDKAGPEPKDDREELAADVIDALRAANRSGDIAGLREKFPPAWEPFLPIIEKKSNSPDPIAWIDNSRIAARILEGGLRRSAEWRWPDVVVIDGDRITKQPDLRFFGTSPDGTLFAFAFDDRVEVRRGWDGPRVAAFDWPSGREGMPPGYEPPEPFCLDQIVGLEVFPDGQRVLLACPQGIFALTATGAIRLLRKEHIEWRFNDNDKSAAECSLSMEHGAVGGRGAGGVVGGQE